MTLLLNVSHCFFEHLRPFLGLKLSTRMFLFVLRWNNLLLLDFLHCVAQSLSLVNVVYILLFFCIVVFCTLVIHLYYHVAAPLCGISLMLVCHHLSAEVSFVFGHVFALGLEINKEVSNCLHNVRVCKVKFNIDTSLDKQVSQGFHDIIFFIKIVYFVLKFVVKLGLEHTSV
jgi:hypothetical protein